MSYSSLVDESKVQLESPQDLSFLQDEVRRFILQETEAKTLSLPDSESFLDEVFQIVKHNIQIAGVDPDKFDGSFEEIDSSLEGRLEDLQIETDNLLVKVAKERREAPQRLLDNLLTSIQGAEDKINTENVSKITEFMANNEIAEELQSESLIDVQVRFISEMQRLQQLTETMPSLVGKIERAQTVLLDSKQKNISPEDELFGDGELTRQKRIALQNDLASKIMNQK